jgi:hypothetical protein
MGCPCRNKVKEAVTSANLPQGDPLASQRAYDANHQAQTQETPQEAVTASAAR